MRLIILAVLSSLVGLAADGAAWAADYPTRPVTLVVPFAAGGPTDTVARLIGKAMSRMLGQPLLVENIGGAGGTLGAARVARADPDGYTVLLHHIGMATQATLYRKLPYDLPGDFAGIGLVTDVPMTIVARKDFSARDMKELVAYLRANRDKVTLANAGVGSASHLCGMLFMSGIAVSLITVPYNGTGPAMNDLVGGQVDLMCDQTTNTTGQIKSGSIRVYAVTSKARVPSLPDVPTTGEAGVPSVQVGIWHGLYAPKRTPAPVIARLEAALQAALQDQTVKARFADLGTEPEPTDRATPAALDAYLKSEIDRWSPIIKAAGVYAD